MTARVTGNSHLIIATVSATQKQEYNEYHAVYFRQRYVDIAQKLAAKKSLPLLVSKKFVDIQFHQLQFDTKSMKSTYQNEQIRYFTQRGLEALQVFPINGVIYKSDLTPYNSTKVLNKDTGDGEMIVMDCLGNMFIAPKDRGIFHHSSFFSGNPVSFAGLCSIKEGILTQLVAYSGHYAPRDTELASFQKQVSLATLVESTVYGVMKVNKSGDLVTVLKVDANERIRDIAKRICANNFFQLHFFQLDLQKDDNTYEDLKIVGFAKTVSQAALKTGDVLRAGQLSLRPVHSIRPDKKFELLVLDEMV